MLAAALLVPPLLLTVLALLLWLIMAPAAVGACGWLGWGGWVGGWVGKTDAPRQIEKKRVGFREGKRLAPARARSTPPSTPLHTRHKGKGRGWVGLRGCAFVCFREFGCRGEASVFSNEIRFAQRHGPSPPEFLPHDGRHHCNPPPYLSLVRVRETIAQKMYQPAKTPRARVPFFSSLHVRGSLRLLLGPCRVLRAAHNSNVSFTCQTHPPTILCTYIFRREG